LPISSVNFRFLGLKYGKAFLDFDPNLISSSFLDPKGSCQILWRLVEKCDRRRVHTHTYIHYIHSTYTDTRQLIWLSAQCYVYKALHGLAPQYLTDFCQPVSLVSGRSGLRSSTRGDLIVVSTSTNFGRRSFAVSAPAAWNQLPSDIRNLQSLGSFKHRLKTHLFNCNCITVFCGTLTIRVLDGALCYGALEIVGLLLLLLLGHIKNIHLHSCKHKTVTLKLTLTLTDTGGAVLTLMLGYKLKRKLQNWDCKKYRGVYS